jgi:peptidoglycan/LPS O-acetylase OafA/YrhL
VHLDAFRAVAALEVFAGHLRQFFLVDYGATVHPRLGARLLFLATGFGHAAVVVFFVLSGYLISRGVVDRIRSHRWSWRPYLVQRWSRLYAVLVPALLLGAAWDTATIAYLPAPMAAVAAQVRARLQLGIGLGNLFFLQEVAVPVLGSNGPLWSLSYEFWYYLIFPCFAIGALGRGVVRRVAYVLAAVILLLALGQRMSGYFAIWLLGTAIALLPAPARRWAFVLSTVGAAGLLACLALSVTAGRVEGPAQDFPTGITFAMLAWGSIGLPEPATGWYPRTAAFLAGRSYTLYLVHYPVLLFISGVIFRGRSWQPSVTSLLATVLIGALVLGYAQLIWVIGEARTDRLREVATRIVDRVTR